MEIVNKFFILSYHFTNKWNYSRKSKKTKEITLKIQVTFRRWKKGKNLRCVITLFIQFCLFFAILLKKNINRAKNTVFVWDRKGKRQKFKLNKTSYNDYCLSIIIVVAIIVFDFIILLVGFRQHKSELYIQINN